MTNTIPNVPRELLERAAYTLELAYEVDTPTVRDIRALLSAQSPADHVEDARAMVAKPSPVGVDGLEVIGWYTEDHLDDKSATTYSKEVAERWLAKGWPVTGIANADDAQAIIDGLRGEVDYWKRMFNQSEKALDRVNALRSRDGAKQAQRIGELEGLLRRAPRDIACFEEWQANTYVALSAGKEGE